ncbi:MAG: hypothetical protein IPM27_01455 [Nitrosomonadales bacterium]|nr:hypothetical protein [Nitrosomonadales bacterium]
MSTNINTWYNFVLEQMAAESYWGQSELFGGNRTAADVLMFGSNNPNQYVGLNPVNLPTLPGATRMTASQADYFLQNYEIVDQLSNTASGFSATLMRNTTTGEYTLSMRSTEYADPDQGGDWLRDGLPGADGEINSYGFALGQILDMEDYYTQLKSTGLLPADATLSVTD